MYRLVGKPFYNRKLLFSLVWGGGEMNMAHVAIGFPFVP